MNNNDSLKEKTIRANELENVSGGSGDAGGKYAFKEGWENCVATDCGVVCCANCPTQALKRIPKLTRYGRVAYVILNQNLCNGCGNCASVCPDHLFIKK
jgi:Pyruvate/2-oxoacid:ferredoxin oxidoreductase delta subunit